MTTLTIFDSLFACNKEDQLNYMEMWFILAIIWGFGASVSVFEGED